MSEAGVILAEPAIANPVAAAWLDANRESPEAAFLRRLMACSPQPMPDWTTYYGWSEVWRWFPSDAFVMGAEPKRPMDCPRFLVPFITGGVKRDVTGCIDFPSRQSALTSLGVAFLAWLAKELEKGRGRDHAEAEEDPVPLAGAGGTAGDRAGGGRLLPGAGVGGVA